MTELVVVERVFEQPVAIADVQAKEDAVAWCLQQHAVQFLRSYFASDRRTMICLYRAPDAEAVRETQRQAGLPVTRLWTASVLGNLEVPAAPPPRATIIVERDFPAPVTMELVEQTLAREGHCLAIHRADLLASHLSRDGRRMFCVFSAPDAESVRIANRQIGMPVASAWPATVYVPAAR
jgi:hypothetical protein